MKSSMGLSCVLSFLIVAAAAIVFYRPARPPATAIGRRAIAGKSNGETKDLVERTRHAGDGDDSDSPIADSKSHPIVIDESNKANNNFSIIDHLRTPESSRSNTRSSDDQKTKTAVIEEKDGAGPDASSRARASRNGSNRAGLERIGSARGAFTKTRRGESLAEVAERVYGTRTAVDSLWRANRDVLIAPDDPIEEGLILRTP